MSETLESSTSRLAEARQRSDADKIAEALAVHANALLELGQTGAAQQALDEAAAIHATQGRAYDEARCLQMAGTLCRFLGSLDEAGRRVSRALELVEAKGPIAVSSHAELGEIAMAAGHGAEAAEAYRAALDAGEGTDLIESAQAALLRRRAAALAVVRRYSEAVRDLETAYDLLSKSGDLTGATRTLIEEATALQHSREFDDAERVIRRAMELANAGKDNAALADIHLLLATQALERRDPSTALLSAQSARTEALAGNAPACYVGAAITISQLSDMAGDRHAAYEALAVGWVTIADILQKELARAAFEPALS